MWNIYPKNILIEIYHRLYRLLSEFRSLIVYFIVDTFYINRGFSTSNVDNKRIMIFKVDAIGDMILWLPASKRIRKHYKDCHITLVCLDTNKELAKSLNYFDEVIGINSRSFCRSIFYRISILKLISRLPTYLAIHPHYSRSFILGDSLVRACLAKEKIGFEGDVYLSSSLQKYISNRNYTKLIPYSGKKLMELELNAKFLEGLGLNSIVPRVATLPILLTLPDQLVIKEPYFIIFPGASTRYRMWSVENFASVAKLVIERFNWRTVICGGPSEHEISSQLFDLIGVPNSFNLTGKTSLPELVEIIRNSKLLIGNETSAVHIAAAVNTPSVCVLGGGHFNRFMPYPETVKGMKPVPVFHPMDCYFCDWHCKLTRERTKPYPCIQNIDVNSVMNAVGKALQASSIENLDLR